MQDELTTSADDQLLDAAGAALGLPEDHSKGRLDRSPRANWVEREGGLPKYIERIAVHLIAKGMSHSHAIAVSINAAKRMCATGDLNFPGSQSVNPGSRAQACAAVAKWNAMRARARARR